MRTANRISKLPPYLFVEISKRIAEKRAKGIDVVSFGIGDPDIPTPAHIVERLCQAAHDPANHRYPETEGLPALRKAISEWCHRRFGLAFDPEKEVLPAIGSKEAISHVALCFIDPGDVALVPDPGYPVYSSGTMFAGGESYWMPLLEQNGFLPDLEKVPPSVADKARLMWINYPNNPTSAVAGMDFFEKVVRFAKKHDIAVCHDAAYTEVAYDGYKPVSFMETPGAKDVGIEFHSFSKSYNMTGWRIGWVLGNPEMINALMRVKSNIDSGIPQAIQLAAIEALQGSQECIAEHNAVYQRRRDLAMKVLTELGLRISPPKASLYLWAGLSQGHTAVDYTARLLNEANVVVTPGIGYGKYGEGYIRLSLTTPDDRLKEGLARLQKWHQSHKG